MWLPVINYQFEDCLIVIFTFFKDFPVLHYASTLTLTCVHDVRPGVKFKWIDKRQPCVKMVVRSFLLYVQLINEGQ